MSFGGRTRVATVPTRARGTTGFSAGLACLTESFDGSDSDTVGPGLSWDQYGWALASGAITSTGFGVGGHVKDDRCSLYAPPDPPGGDPDQQWLQCAITTRTTTGYASDVAITADMAHPGEIGGPGNEGNMIVGWNAVMARMETDALDANDPSFPSVTGWWCRGELGGGYQNWRIKIGWQTPSYFGTLTDFAFGTTPPTSIGLTIIGDDMDLVVSSYANGSHVQTYTMDQIINDEGYSDVLDDPTFLPRGTRVGFEEYGGVEFSVSGGVTTGSYHDQDDLVWIDNFEACAQ